MLCKTKPEKMYLTVPDSNHLDQTNESQVWRRSPNDPYLVLTRLMEVMLNKLWLTPIILPDIRASYDRGMLLNTAS